MPQTDVEGAVQLAEDLRAQVAEVARPAPEAEAVTISVGVAMFGPAGTVGREAVLVAADEAMYRAKEEGRNRVVLYQEPERQGRGARATDDFGADPRRPHQRPPQPPQPGRSTALPRAGSSATSCCCG